MNLGYHILEWALLLIAPLAYFSDKPDAALLFALLAIYCSIKNLEHASPADNK